MEPIQLAMQLIILTNPQIRIKQETIRLREVQIKQQTLQRTMPPQTLRQILQAIQQEQIPQEIKQGVTQPLIHQAVIQPQIEQPTLLLRNQSKLKVLVPQCQWITCNRTMLSHA